MCAPEPQIEKLKNKTEQDIQYSTMQQKLNESKQTAFQNNQAEVQGVKKQKGRYSSAAEKNVYLNILKNDFQTQNWIEKDAAVRKTRKHINENYKDLLGKGTFGGLGSKELKERKQLFEGKRIISNNASQQVADLLNSEWGEDVSTEDLVAEMKNVEPASFQFDNDEELVENFSKNMQVLQRAGLLLDRLRSEADVWKSLTNPDEIIRNLYIMEDIRKAYQERITIITSPYYTSLREEDLSGENIAQMNVRSRKTKKNEGFVKALTEWEERKTRAKFHQGREQHYDMGYLMERYYQEFGNNERILKIRNEQENELESGRTVDKIFDQIVRSSTYAGIQNGNKNYLVEFYGNSSAISNLMKENVYEFEYGTGRKKNLTKNDLVKAIDSMIETADKLQQKINEGNVNNIPKQWKGQREQSELSASGEQLRKIRDKVLKDEVSLDVARLWLNRSFSSRKNYDFYEESDELGLFYSQLENMDYFTTSKVYTGGDRFQWRAENRIPEIGNVVGNFMENLNRNGYVSLRGAEEDEISQVNFVHSSKKRSKESILADERLGIVQHTKQRDDLADVCGKKGTKVGNMMHIVGGDYKPGKASYRVYISAKDMFKTRATEIFLETAVKLGFQNKLRIHLRLGDGHPRNDDMAVFFSEDMQEKDRQHLLEEFQATCELENTSILSDDLGMPAGAVKYRKGISVASETLVNTMNEIKGETEELKQYDSQKQMQKINGEEFEKKNKGRFGAREFILDMFMQSAMLAKRRLGNSGFGGDREFRNDNPIMVLETKRIFRELLTLNGVDPETMLNEDAKKLFNK